MYIARQLSFEEVRYRIEEVFVTKKFRRIYDISVKLWVEAKEKFTDAADLISSESSVKKAMWEQFWASHHRFFKYLCIAPKVSRAILLARECIKNGKSVVISLQSTGEERTDCELTDFASTAQDVFQSLVEQHFPAPSRNEIHRNVALYNKLSSSLNSSSNCNINNSSAAAKRKGVATGNDNAKKIKKRSSSDQENADGEEEKSPYSDNSNDAENNSASNVRSDIKPFASGCSSETIPQINPRNEVKKTEIETEEGTSSKASDTALNAAKARRSQLSMRIEDMKLASAMKEDLLSKIKELGSRLPQNSIDQLIEDLGGPNKVAEMSGRRRRPVQNVDGSIQYESHSNLHEPLEWLNTKEKDSFMWFRKKVAIVVEPASGGISLHSDRGLFNKQPRVHITLELPLSVDRAIEQFGRTHRTSQVHSPEYIFLIMDLASERRLAFMVAKRLESLGALTHGDRRATGTRDLSQFNIDSKYGRQALGTVMRTIMGHESPLVPPATDSGERIMDFAVGLMGVGMIVNSETYPGTLSLVKDYNNISMFLNRILGCPMELQHRLFKYFTDTMTATIQQAKCGNQDTLDMPSFTTRTRASTCRTRCVIRGAPSSWW
ncbi:hypothetical protein KR032_004278 [Drosophila birchii]|nr:hypothetical protein KR032_004278 [Drosophila birchii]